MKKLSIEKLPFYFSLCSAILGFFVFFHMGLAAIDRHRGPTSGIGILFLPIEGLYAAFFCSIFGYCLGYLMREAIITPKRWLTWRSSLAALVVVPTVIITVIISIEVQETKSMIQRIGIMNSEQLDKTVDQLIAGKQKMFQPFILSAIAQNGQTSNKVLFKIAHIRDVRLYKSLFTQWGSGFDILGDSRSRRGMAVMRLVVLHPNVTTQILTDLSLSPQNNYVVSDIAGNPKTSKMVLRKLFQQKHNVNSSLATNPKTPLDILISLAKSNDREILLGIATNPSAPQDLRKKVKDKLNALGGI